MEPSSLMEDAEFRLPPEFLTDDDFLLEKEHKLFKDDESNLFPCELSHGFGLDSSFGSTVNQTGDEENYLTGLTRKTVRSNLEDDFSGGFCGNHAFPAGKAWGATCSPLCGAGDGYGRRNQNCQTRVSSQAAAAAAWDLYCAAVEKLTMMSLNGYNNHNSRRALDIPRKHLLATAKGPDGGTGYYSRQSIQYQKLQAIQFQQLKQQQLMQQSRGFKANNNKIAGHVDFSPPAWSNHLGDRTGKRGSTGTGVFLPRLVNHTEETHEKPCLATVLVPGRVAEVLDLDESLVQQPLIRSSASLYEASLRQKSGFSSQMKMEQGVNEPRLPSDWAY